MIFIFLIIGVAALSVWSTLNVKYVRDGVGEETRWSPAFVLGGGFLAASIYLAVLWGVLLYLGYIKTPTVSAFWSALVVTVLLNIFFKVLLFKAYQLSDLGLIAPFAAVTPLLTVAASWVLIKELPTIGGTAGILLIVISIYGLHLKNGKGWRTVYEPFRAMWENKGMRYAFFASIPPAISIVFDKKAITAADPITFSFIAAVLIGVGAWGVDYLLQGRSLFVRQFSRARMRRFLGVGFFYFIALVSFNAMLVYDVVPHVSALRRSVIVFEVLLGYYILKQRDDLKKRVLASIGVVAGVILIALFR